MKKGYQRITLNIFLDASSEIDVTGLITLFKCSSDYQHDNLSICPDGEFAIISDIYAADFEDPARSRAAVKKLFEDILKRL